MPMMEVNLPQLLKAIEQLNPAELAILQERIHRTQHAASVKTSPKTAQRDEFFTLPFTEYLALPDEERERIQFSVYQSQKKWIDAELEQRSAEWILVCGGEVVEASETLRNYPSREKLMALGKARGVVPFVFVKAPLIEEGVLMMKEILDLKEAAELLKMSPRALREAAERGEVPGRRVAKRWRFSRFALHQWLSGPENPYKKHIGALTDNPLWTEVMQTIQGERERQRLEARKATGEGG